MEKYFLEQENKPIRAKEKQNKYFFIQKRKSYKIYPLEEQPGCSELLYSIRLTEVDALSGAYYRKIDSKHISIEYVQNGSLAAKQNGKTFLLNAGDIFLMQPNKDNSYLVLPNSRCKKISLLIQGPLLEHFLKLSNLYDIDVIRNVDTVRLEQFFNKFRDLSSVTGANKLEKNSILSYSILKFLQNPYCKSNIPDNLRELVLHLENNPDKPLSLAEMASIALISKSHLIRSFKQYYGTSPFTIHQEIRLKYAASQLLQHPELYVKEISEKLNFNDPLNFSTSFKAVFGYSPKEYRKIMSHNT